jgi:antitoxin VapB
MALLINPPEVDALAQELSIYTGESALQAALIALRERLARERAKRVRPGVLKDALLSIGRECAALPVLDARPADEILSYDEKGVPV